MKGKIKVIFVSLDNHHHLEVFDDDGIQYAGPIDAEAAERVRDNLLADARCCHTRLCLVALGLRTGWSLELSGETAWLDEVLESLGDKVQVCGLGRLLDTANHVSKCEAAHEEDGCWLYRS